MTGIIMQADSIKGILAGRKTQTRRLLSPQPPDWVSELGFTAFTPAGQISGRGTHPEYGPAEKFFKLPYQVGQRLWVREAFRPKSWSADGGWGEIEYQADGRVRLVDGPWSFTDAYPYDKDPNRWRLARYMPRWASRITLELTEVRAQRLQAITEADAIAEGARHFPDLPSLSRYGQDPRWSCYEPTSTDQCLHSARHAFGNAWNKLNGDRADWDSNPWVWALSFKRVQP
jgi:hypothetical protein